MRISHNDVIFAYDFDRLTTSGQLFDHGPLGLHATPGAGAAAPTRQLDGSYSFDGGDYFALSGDSQTRFYANAPTGPYTLLFAYTANTAGSYFFSCVENVAGNWFGFAAGIEPTLGTTQVYNMIGNATLPRIVGTLSSSVSRSRVAVLTIETTPRHIVDQALATAPTWTVGAFGAPAYSATAPRIGGSAAVGTFNGMLRFLCLLRGAVSSSDMAELSALMMNGVKPFCGRT